MRSMWKDPNIWVGIGIAAIVFPTLIWAIAVHGCADDVDNGLLYVDVGGERIQLFPSRSHLPPWDVIGDKTIDGEVLGKATSVWNTGVGGNVLRSRIDQRFFDDPAFELSPQYRFGSISVTMATHPSGEGCGGITHHNYDTKIHPGEVYWVEILINPMFAYNKDTYIASLVHELGHALLLAHDDHRTSIMRKRLNVRGVITDHDAELVRKTWITERHR